MKSRRLLVGALSLSLILGLSACAEEPDRVTFPDFPEVTVSVPVPQVPEVVSYVPEIGGEDGHCYYLEDEAEVESLKDAGLCPEHWTPMLMPLYWRYQYSGFYDSDLYLLYIPQTSRSKYQERSRVFKQQHGSDIQKYSSKGRWTGSDGRRYSGADVSGNVQSGKGNVVGNGNVRPKVPVPPVNNAPRVNKNPAPPVNNAPRVNNQAPAAPAAPPRVNNPAPAAPAAPRMNNPAPPPIRR